MGAKFQPFTVPRKSAMHDMLEGHGGSIASASFIRSCIEENEEYDELVPLLTAHALAQAGSNGCIGRLRNLERLILYRLRTVTQQELEEQFEMGPGLDGRILDVYGLATRCITSSEQEYRAKITLTPPQEQETTETTEQE